MEGWIEAGRVVVDGQVAKLGSKVSGEERISVDGRVVRAPQRVARPKVIIYHKPQGEICTRSDPMGRPTVYDKLPRLSGGRWIGVGRLDFQTSGLLLLTTDGELANVMMHPSSELPREYSVRVLGEVADHTLRRVSRLIRIRYGPVSLPRSLRIGKHRFMNSRELETLYAAVNLELPE